MKSGGGIVSVAVLWAGTASVAAAQTLGQGGDNDIPWLRLIAALLLCLGLAAGAAFALDRRLKGGAGLGSSSLSALLRFRLPASETRRARLTDIETRQVSTQVTVSVFKCDSQNFLVAASAQGQLVLVSLDAEPSESDA